MPTVRQLDVYAYPQASLRRTLPFVVIVQSDGAHTGRSRLVVPMARRRDIAGDIAGVLVPIVRLDEAEYAVLVPLAFAITSDLLRESKGSLSEHDAIVRAFDLLLTGA
jgi:hypothetical protein